MIQIKIFSFKTTTQISEAIRVRTHCKDTQVGSIFDCIYLDYYGLFLQVGMQSPV